jgi:hypothetical protein
MLNVVVLVSFMLCRKYAHYAECRSAKCLYAECLYAECLYAECRSAKCLYAECSVALNVIQQFHNI